MVHSKPDLSKLTRIWFEFDTRRYDDAHRPFTNKRVYFFPYGARREVIERPSLFGKQYVTREWKSRMSTFCAASEEHYIEGKRGVKRQREFLVSCSGGFGCAIMVFDRPELVEDLYREFRPRRLHEGFMKSLETIRPLPKD